MVLTRLRLLPMLLFGLYMIVSAAASCGGRTNGYDADGYGHYY